MNTIKQCSPGQYAEYFWWTMHHSDEPERQALTVTCYLDESGTHDQSPITVVAGLLLNRHNFISLSGLWGDLLSRYKIKPPFHMKEFGQHGKMGHLKYNERHSLFCEIAEIVNAHKIFSLAATVDQQQFREICNFNKGKMSSYSLCFYLCVQLNHLQAEYMKYRKNIAFLLDEGGEHTGQILAAHKAIVLRPENKKFHVGSITFANDKDVSALQIADIIAWAVLRRLVGKPFEKGFSPIEKILNENHIQKPWGAEYLKGLKQTFDAMLGTINHEKI